MAGAAIVSVTAPRLPFVREIFPGVWAAGGYSGQGVALAPFVGKAAGGGGAGPDGADCRVRRASDPRASARDLAAPLAGHIGALARAPRGPALAAQSDIGEQSVAVDKR